MVMLNKKIHSFIETLERNNEFTNDLYEIKKSMGTEFTKAWQLCNILRYYNNKQHIDDKLTLDQLSVVIELYEEEMKECI